MTVSTELARSLVAALDDEAVAAAAGDLAAVANARRGGTLDLASIPGVPRGALEYAAAEFVRRGWLVRRDHDWAVPLVGMPSGLPDFFQGVLAQRACLADKETSRTAVTMPVAPSALAAVLPSTGMAHAALLTTADAMERVAAEAQGSLTILTPFINAEGLRFAARLFERSPATNRTLVVRLSADVARVLADGADCFNGHNVQVLNYRLSCEGGYETFHAKVVLADRHVAYIGSANMLGYLRHSVELGVIVRGRPAHVVSTVVRAIEVIAVPMTMA